MSLHLTLAPPSTISSIMICTSLLSTPLTCIICGVSPIPPPIDVGVTVPDLDRNGGVLRPVVLCIGEPECYKFMKTSIIETNRIKIKRGTYRKITANDWWCGGYFRRKSLGS